MPAKPTQLPAPRQKKAALHGSAAFRLAVDLRAGLSPESMHRFAIAPNPYRAILWDNDGVLVDTERWYYRATGEVLAEVGIDVTPAVYAEHFLTQAGGITELGAMHGLGAEPVAKLRQRRDRRYEDYLATQTLTIPGVKETLQALRPHFRMGIVTSSRRDHFEMIHRRTGLLPYFDFTLAQGEYARCKPAPDPYLAGIARTGFPAAQCIAIEDAPRGLAAARAAGLDCWIVETELNRGASFAGASRILENISEMIGLLGRGTSEAADHARAADATPATSALSR